MSPSKKRSKAAAAATHLLDSSEPLLFHLEDQPLRHQVPARHLTGADLAYQHRVRSLRADPRTAPAAPTDDELRAIADELVASGAFSYAPLEEAPDPEPEAPAAPAEEN